VRRGSTDGPIAILAAGAGGLAVARRLEALVPHEDVVVLGDQAYAPYAARSPRVVVDRVSRLVDDLVGDGAKLVVLASAAATGDALATVRARLPAGVPVLGFEGVLPHAAARAAGRPVLAVVGAGCLRGLPHAQALRRVRGGAAVTTVAWPGLAEAVEAGGAGLADVVARGLAGVDEGEVLALACAHAAAAGPYVEAAAGGRAVVDGAAVTAERVRLTLARNGLLAHRRRRGRRIVMTTWPDRARGLAAGASRAG
jgi:glutamate racemase